MASDFIKILGEVRGTNAPTEAYTDGIYHDITIKTTEADNVTPRLGAGLYGSMKIMHSNMDSVYAISAELLVLEAMAAELHSLYTDRIALNSIYTDKLTLDSIYADKITLDSIYADKLKLDSLYTDKGVLDSLFADKATLDSIFNDKAKLDSLFTDKLILDSLYADKAVLDGLYTSKSAIDSLFIDKTALVSLYTDKATLDSLFADKLTLDSIFADKVTLDRIYTSISNIDTVAASVANVDITASISAAVTTVAGIDTEVVSLYSDKLTLDSLYADKATLDSIYADKTALDSVYADIVKGLGTNQPTDSAILNALNNANTAIANANLTAADVLLTHADVVLTHSDVVTTQADAFATNADATQTSLDAIATSADVTVSSANVVLTNADVILTHADAAQTGLDRAATNADVVSTQADAASAQSALSAINIIFDNFDDRFLGSKVADPSTDNDGDPLQPGVIYWNTTNSEVRFYNGSSWEAPSVAATAAAAAALISQNAAAASALSASNDLIATNADVALTHADVILTNADVVTTNANAAQTVLDASSTAADAVITDANATITSNNVTAAQTAQGIAETARDEAVLNADFIDDLILGAKISDPSLDNDGNALQIGAIYYNTSTVPKQLRIWDGAAWNSAVFDSSGFVTSFNTRVGAVTLTAADINSAMGFTVIQTDQNYTTAEQLKLSGIEDGATADQTKVDIDALGIDAATVGGYDTAATATVNTIAVRDASGDISARLLRSNYATAISISDTSDICFRVDGATDDYLRFIDKAGLIAWLSAGTSLDADLLDGQHGAYYLDATNIAAGTISDARLPATISSDITGNAATASKLGTARSVTLSGDVSGTTSFDGSANVSITAVVADNSHSHTWSNVTLTPTTLTGYGITDALPITGKAADSELLDGQDSTVFEKVANKGIANGYASLDSSGVIPAIQLPSFVDDVLEYINLASFPVTGETGKIYVATDTSKTYRWTGTVYIAISSGSVDSVDGQTGVVSLTSVYTPLSHVGSTGNAHGIATAAVNGFMANTDKTKLDGITAGANVNVTTDISTTHAATTVTVVSSDGADGVILAASPTTAGVMTAADKVRFDAIESGATADQTASEILTLIKTVDGAASGLDADLLDGQSGAFYQSASNINAGTINDLYLPATISSDITGNASTATSLATGRNFSISGDVTAPVVAFDGSGNIVLNSTIANDAVTFDKIQNVVTANTLLGSTVAGGIVSELSAGTVRTILGIGAGSTYDYTGVALTGATVFNDMEVLDGVVTGQVTTRDISLADLGYTGATNANEYVLPVASPIVLGGVKSGTDVSIDVSGNISVNDNSHAHTWSNITSTPTTLSGYGITDALPLTGKAADSDLLDGQDSSAYEQVVNKGLAGGYASLDVNGFVPATQLPSFVDDILEYTDLASFPVTGETGKIYVALDTNKTYRWSGSAYVYITSGAVDSVDGQTGVVSLSGVYAPLSHVGSTGASHGVATQVVNGFMAAADKTKLDAIETGATQDQTASEILTLIKTVDGTLSGLDSDLLDGQHGSYYGTAAAVALNTAKVSNVTTNLSIGTRTATTTDVNSSDGTNATIPAVTTVLSGLMISTDKVKLDGIETGATADQSASEILTLVKSVDGTGSGLDADTVDGKHANELGATGGGTNAVFYENDQTVTTDYTITSGKNAMSAGPITVNTGIVVTIPTGSAWVIT